MIVLSNRHTLIRIHLNGRLSVMSTSLLATGLALALLWMGYGVYRLQGHAERSDALRHAKD